MPAKRKRGSSKKHSKAMEAQLEQHRDEINNEADGQDTQKTDTTTAETGRTDTDVTADGTGADEANAADTVDADAAETARGTDRQQPDETDAETADGKTDAEPDADKTVVDADTDADADVEEATENVDDGKTDGDGPQAASDGDLLGEKGQDETEAEGGGADTDEAENDGPDSDGNDTHAEDADMTVPDSDTEGSPVEADADDIGTEDGNEPAEGDAPDADETDTDATADAHEDDVAETPDAKTDGAEDGQHTTELSDGNTTDVPSQPAADATDSRDDEEADSEAETVTEENGTAEADAAEPETAGGTTDTTADDTETNRADGAEDDSNAPQEQEPEQEPADVDTESDEADDKNDVEDTADGKEGDADTPTDTADTPAGAHFAAGDVTAAFDKSIEQAKAIVDSLTGKRDEHDGTEATEKGDDDASGIGVEIKTAEEIAESVIGKHGDEEEFKKTIAKLDEMIDEETAKATDGHDAGNGTEDACVEKEADEAADGDTETDSDSDGGNDLKAAAKSVAGWFKGTASSIRESVSAKITETKAAVEKAKAEREQKRQEELERKEAEEKAAKEAAADASLTINETTDSDENRNDLTADDASKITSSEQAAAGDTETAKPEAEAEDVADNETEPQQVTEPDKATEPEPTAPTPDTETAATDEKEGGTGGDAADEKPGTGQTERPDTQTDGRGEDGGKTQPQTPYAYRQPSRRERRRARKAYGAYGDVSAFERNAYRPDPDKIYGIDPRAYADMRQPQMPAGVPIDPSRIVIIDAANAPRTLRQGVGLETADGRYVSKKQGSGAAIAILVVAMLISGATAAIVTGLVTGTTSSTKSVIQTVAENINEASRQPAGQAFKNAQASVVSVYSYQATSSYGFGIFGYDPSADENSTSTVMSGIGSGVVINGNGDILTNAHIVNGYSDIMVKVGDREYSAALLGIDEESDLAVIHIEGATDLKSLAFADSSKVGIGDVASTIGAPYGYDKTLSNGIISSIDRNGTYETTDGMPMYISIFQTDANVNAQNAGGALVDSAGNLIGINVQTKGIAGGQGLSTAIPSNYAKKVADQIIANGEASHGRIGVELRTDDTGAVAIYSVSKGSSASTAGMKAGDVIVSVGNSKIKSPSDFMMAIEEQPIGEYTSIKVKRDGIEQTLKVKVEAGKVTPKTKVDGGESTKG